MTRRPAATPPEPPAWLAEGARVDYHAVIGGPITEPGRVVRAGPELLGGHTWVVWLEGKSGCVACAAVTPADARRGA